MTINKTAVSNTLRKLDRIKIVREFYWEGYEEHSYMDAHWYAYDVVNWDNPIPDNHTNFGEDDDSWNNPSGVASSILYILRNTNPKTEDGNRILKNVANVLHRAGYPVNQIEYDYLDKDEVEEHFGALISLLEFSVYNY